MLASLKKQCNDMIIERDLCVYFVLEEFNKGPSAKDVREEDTERVARVKAKVYYGKVDQNIDLNPKQPTNEFGFIVPQNPHANSRDSTVP